MKTSLKLSDINPEPVNLFRKTWHTLVTGLKSQFEETMVRNE